MKLFNNNYTTLDEALIPVLSEIELKWIPNTGLELPTATKLREVASYLNVNPEHIFVSGNPFIPYFYCHQHIWYDLSSLNLDQLKNIHAREQIQQQANGFPRL